MGTDVRWALLGLVTTEGLYDPAGLSKSGMRLLFTGGDLVRQEGNPEVSCDDVTFISRITWL